jgi:hypothetical protein
MYEHVATQCSNYNVAPVLTTTIYRLLRACKSSGNVTLLANCFMLVCCFVYCPTLKMETKCYSETSVDFQLHSVIFQKIEVIISAAVRTS